MERKIGEEFDYNGVTLRVETGGRCTSCCFCSNAIGCMEHDVSITGKCFAGFRKDTTAIFFYAPYTSK